MLVSAHGGERLQEAFAGDAVALKDARRCTAGGIVGEREQQMLDRDVGVLEPAGLPLGSIEGPRQALGEEHLAWGRPRAGRPRLALDRLPHLGEQNGQVDAGRFDEARDQSALLGEQREQEVFVLGLRLPAPGRDALRFLNGFLGLLGQLVHVHGGVSFPERIIHRRFSRTSIRASRSMTRATAA